MSRIGKKHIVIPEGVNVTINGRDITVEGKLGKLTRTLNEGVSVEKQDGVLVVNRVNDAPKNRALHGLNRQLVANMVEGVSKGYSKNVIINGVGYKASKSGNKLVLNIGFSHPVEIEESDGVTFEIVSATEIACKGIDKEKVGQIAANIRSKRPCEPYHGYGIRYANEVVRRKEGKKAGKK